MSLELTQIEQNMLAGEHGFAARKSMEILVALAKIYAADRMIPVSSVQVAGVSYDNLGDAGLEFIETMADGGGKARVLTTLNPAGIDIQDWQRLGVDEQFAKKQKQILTAFARMNVITTCTCTPYLAGNLPHYGEHIAWAESSAVCYANSVIGARTNREGGPSALASAITGVTPQYGLHLTHHRKPDLCVEVTDKPDHSSEQLATSWFGALGKIIGQELERKAAKHIPLIRGLPGASLEELKSFCASIATYGGVGLFHIEGITPEADLFEHPQDILRIEAGAVDQMAEAMRQITSTEVDFINLGCPHLSIKEIAYIAHRLEGHSVNREFWITTARTTKQISDMMGYTQIIEQSGVKFAADTCCIVAPIKGKYHALATDSAKACYYGYAKNAFDIYFNSLDDILNLAIQDANREQSA
jgi:hypothetical protein